MYIAYFSRKNMNRRTFITKKSQTLMLTLIPACGGRSGSDTDLMEVEAVSKGTEEYGISKENRQWVMG